MLCNRKYQSVPGQLYFKNKQTNLEQENLQFVWKHKKTQMAKTILGKIDEAGGIGFLDIRQYYKATVIKTVW